MKLDRNFYTNLSGEVLNSKKEYRKKYTIFLIFGTLLWWTVCWWLVENTDTVRNFASDQIEFFLLLLALPIIAYFIGYKNIAERAQDKIFENIAKINNGTFEQSSSLEGEKAAIFRQGHSRKIKKVIRFKDGDKIFRFFEYHFSTGYGKSKINYSYHIFGMGGSGIVPHMYLNHHKSGYSLFLGKKLSLPSLFEKQFTLSIPEGYHLEALQVFTPDILASILDLPIKCDIEFVDGEMLFLLDGMNNIFNDFEKLQRLVEGAENIIVLLKPKLENLRWAPVGDKTFSL